MLTLSSTPSFSGMNKASDIHHPKFGEAPQQALTSKLIADWDKTSDHFIGLIKPQLPEIQKGGKAFKEAVDKGDHAAAQKHYEASLDRMQTLVVNTLQAMKSKFPEALALQQAPQELKKQVSQHINRTMAGKFQQMAKQRAKANAPKLEPEVTAVLDKAITQSVEAMKPELPAFIKAKLDYQKATERFFQSSEKALKDVASKISRELPESLKERDSPRDYNRMIAEYSRQLTKQRLYEATQDLMKKSTAQSGA